MGISHREHQAKIVRLFPPFLSDATLGQSERIRFGLAWLMLIQVALPVALVIFAGDYQNGHSWIVILSLCITVAQCCLATYRYWYEWPIGLRYRWNYWHEIEMANPQEKMSILSYFHKNISRYLGTSEGLVDNEGMDSTYANCSSKSTKMKYSNRYKFLSISLLTLLNLAYAASLVTVIWNENAVTSEEERHTHSDPEGVNASFTSIKRHYNRCIFCAILLSFSCSFISVLIAQKYFINLPQAIELRSRPELTSGVTIISTDETPLKTKRFANYSSHVSASKPEILKSTMIDVASQQRKYSNSFQSDGISTGMQNSAVV